MAAVALGRDFEFKTARPEVCPTGMAEVDAMAGGLPQGCLTEIYGPASSGRTSLMLAAMAQSTGARMFARWWIRATRSIRHPPRRQVCGWSGYCGCAAAATPSMR